MTQLRKLKNQKNMCCACYKFRLTKNLTRHDYYGYSKFFCTAGYGCAIPKQAARAATALAEGLERGEA